MEVATYRKEKIYVPESVRKIYEILGLGDEILSTNQEESYLWQASLRHVTELDLKKKNLEIPTIAIVLTASGLLRSSGPKTRNGIKSTDDEAESTERLVYTVSYSNHCCASELAKFLSFLRPAKVERIVDRRINNSSANPSVIDLYLASKSSGSCSQLSSDMEDTANGDYDELYFASQKKTGASQEELMETSFHSAASEDMLPATPPTSSGFQTPENQPALAISTTQSEEVFVQTGLLTVEEPPPPPDDWEAKAESLLVAINAQLDECQGDPGDVIYSPSFVSKLLALTKIYEPVTGISFQPI